MSRVTADGGEVAADVVARVRSRCADLPEVVEEPAWVGVRWRIRTHTFAHVVPVAGGHPPAYARAVGCDGPLVVLTFRSSGDELQALANVGPPFFKPPWFPDIVGVVVDGSTDWDEIGELVAESYRLLAPRRLAAEVEARLLGGDR